MVYTGQVEMAMPAPIIMIPTQRTGLKSPKKPPAPDAAGTGAPWRPLAAIFVLIFG